MKSTPTDHDPNHILPKEEHDFHYLSKKFHINTLAKSVVVLTILLVGTLGFTGYNAKRLTTNVRQAECKLNPESATCLAFLEEKQARLDLRCELHPEMKQCLKDGTPDPEDPFPGTDPEEDDYTFTSTVSMPEGFKVPAGEIWTLNPNKDTTVTVSANVVVEGVLEMKPNPGVNHTLRFTNVDEGDFIGGGALPLLGDIGLWVTGDGVLDLQGEKKTAWDYSWQPEWAGDEVVSAPHTEGEKVFSTITSSSQVPAKNTYGYSSELLNLTRSVNIEGTAEGKIHIFIKSELPQTLKYVGIRYVGPQFGISDQTGRYGIHFHHNMDGSRGTILEGVVIRDADNHAFVPHRSHGITIIDSIAYNTKNPAFWWDPDEAAPKIDNSTDDVTIDNSVAAKTSNTVEFNESGLGAFTLESGQGNKLTNSVAVGGVGAPSTASKTNNNTHGFTWYGGQTGLWNFTNNIAHNMDGNGIDVYQNTGAQHIISDFDAYFNVGYGVEHGAYFNAYSYKNLTLMSNAQGAIHSNAVAVLGTKNIPPQNWDNIKSNGAFLMGKHVAVASAPILVTNCEFSDIKASDNESRGNPGWYEFSGCTVGNVSAKGLNPLSAIMYNGSVLQKGNYY